MHIHSDDETDGGILMNDNDLDENNNDDLINGTKYQNDKMDLNFDLPGESGFVDSVIDDTTFTNNRTSDGNDNIAENDSSNGSSQQRRGRHWSSKNNNTKIILAPIPRNIGKKVQDFKSRTVNNVHKLEDVDSINNNDGNNNSNNNTGSMARHTQHHTSTLISPQNESHYDQNFQAWDQNNKNASATTSGAMTS